MVTVTNTDLITAYYDTWKNGIASFDEARLRGMLAPDFVYEGRSPVDVRARIHSCTGSWPL